MSAESEFEAVLAPSAQPPSVAQLAALTAIPSALAGAMNQGRGGRRRNGNAKGRGAALAREGQIVSRTFDAFGSRPQPRNGLNLQQQITMEFQVSSPYLTTSTVVGGITYGGINVTIGSFAAASSVLSVFDQYKFEQVEIWLEFQAPNAQVSFPELYTAVDLDDANMPTQLGQVADHIGSIVSVGPGGHYHKWKPHVALATYSGAFTSYANSPAQWIDSASPNVQHYGLKVACRSADATPVVINAVTRAVVSFRAPAIN